MMKSEPRIKIFTEGSDTIGFGHLSRCSALYDEAVRQGVSVVLYIQVSDYDFAANSILKNRNYQIVNWQSVEYLRKNLNKNDFCIVDSYLATIEIYNEIAQISYKALYIDDYGRLDYPKGIVVNPSLSTEGINYPRKSDIEYLLGHEYIILRTPFIGQKKRILSPHIKNVLITMGGTDIKNMTEKITQQLAPQFPEIFFKIVSGKNSKELMLLRRFDNVEVYKNLIDQEMCNMMLQSDFAITATGQTIYELLAMKIPFIAIQTADNQRNNVNSLKKFVKKEMANPLVEDAAWQKMINILREVVDYSVLVNVSDAIENYIDGLGGERMIKRLIDKKTIIILKEVTLSDSDLLFCWANDEQVRKNAFNSEHIEYENHVAWLKNKINCKQTQMFIAYVDDTPIGQIRVEINSFGEGEIDYSIDSYFRGYGFGGKVLDHLISLFDGQKLKQITRLIGKVKNDNLASQKAFIKAGFHERKMDDYYSYSYELNRES